MLAIVIGALAGVVGLNSYRGDDLVRSVSIVHEGDPCPGPDEFVLNADGDPLTCSASPIVFADPDTTYPDDDSGFTLRQKDRIRAYVQRMARTRVPVEDRQPRVDAMVRRMDDADRTTHPNALYVLAFGVVVIIGGLAAEAIRIDRYVTGRRWLRANRSASS